MEEPSGPDPKEGQTNFLKRKAGKAVSILVAEDDEVLRAALVRDLEKLGHDVHATGDGEEAWRIYNGRQIQVIITDWHMPGLDGLLLARRVREAKKRRYTYIIMVSAATIEKDMLDEAMDAGVDDFLAKPFNRSDLFLRLRVASRIVLFQSEISELRHLLPICMYCQKIRDDGNYWHDIQTYLSEHSMTDFSHGVCPDCADQIVRPQIKKKAEH